MRNSFQFQFKDVERTKKKTPVGRSLKILFLIKSQSALAIAKLVAHWRPHVKFWLSALNFKSQWRPRRDNLNLSRVSFHLLIHYKSKLHCQSCSNDHKQKN